MSHARPTPERVARRFAAARAAAHAGEAQRRRGAAVRARAPRARAPIMASTKPPMIFSRRKPPPRRAGDETSDTDARAAQDELMADSSIYVDKRVLFVEDSDDAPDAENTAPRFTDKTPNRDTNQDTDIGASDDLIVQGQGKIVSDWENMSF